MTGPDAVDDAAAAPDPRAWRALAHPLRLRILEQLQMRSALRASDLGAAIGEPVNSMSFHLRQLARFGYVEQCDPPDGRLDRRARWWRATAPGGVRVTDDVDDAAAAAAARAVADVYRTQAHRQLDAWFERDDSVTTSRSTNFDVHLALTPQQWEEALGELRDLLHRWMAISRTGPSSDAAVEEHLLLGFGAARRALDAGSAGTPDEIVAPGGTDAS